MRKFILLISTFILAANISAQQKIDPPVTNIDNSYVIENPSYKLGFAGIYGIPIWEMHELKSEMLQKSALSNEEWKTDNRVKGYRINPKDFANIKLEPVQLFPKEHAGDNIPDIESSFLTSNLVFMNKQMKETIWDRITNSFQIIAARMKVAYLYSGPVFEKDNFRLKYILNNKVATPSYFYRIALFYENGKPAYKCYKIPNRIPTDYERKCDIDEFECNIYQLEADTNIDFFDRDIDANFRQDKLKFLEKQVK